ncbi:hypothetical protein HRR83_002696 [Exophiala dermatitidis]|uniref:Uncharacterized protein n=1 Tax=Exophiala dermatitidis TaxID=5970 RepID=A0AAN6IVY0_EXODE|nr:hypothetical protein HRR74_003870 [Exophiala dermatitidis]KAJ4522012.1 hypothetical protein HRR73_003211 [Exophiala dermatitidis]KAJ4537471.1 hypothetical protein HRR76_005473 [Exophiala dermatitidis]KAJ4551861.1 hypothetical protein HRR77_003083 [Exophiala dermatitidis]KAJ4561464.1 hypothetical protein HRR81_009429 [Exophiala dermatitidis]
MLQKTRAEQSYFCHRSCTILVNRTIPMPRFRYGPDTTKRPSVFRLFEVAASLLRLSDHASQTAGRNLLGSGLQTALLYEGALSKPLYRKWLPRGHHVRIRPASPCSKHAGRYGRAHAHVRRLQHSESA